MGTKLVLFVVVLLTSGCSAKVSRSNQYKKGSHEMVVSLRTSDAVNTQLFQRYLSPVGLPGDYVHHGHVTVGWIRHIDPLDVKPLEKHMQRYFNKINPKHYLFTIDRLGEYKVNRKPGNTPLILLPKTASSFKRLNYFLDQHLRTFKGRRTYALSVGTEPDLYVPHLTVVHEGMINQRKINRLRTKFTVNRLIRVKPMTFRFDRGLIKIKGENKQS